MRVPTDYLVVGNSKVETLCLKLCSLWLCNQWFYGCRCDRRFFSDKRPNFRKLNFKIICEGWSGRILFGRQNNRCYFGMRKPQFSRQHSFCEYCWFAFPFDLSSLAPKEFRAWTCKIPITHSTVDIMDDKPAILQSTKSLGAENALTMFWYKKVNPVGDAHQISKNKLTTGIQGHQQRGIISFSDQKS